MKGLSTHLLSLALSVEVVYFSIDEINPNKINYNEVVDLDDIPQVYKHKINVHILAYCCKVWARDVGYQLLSSAGNGPDNNAICYIDYTDMGMIAPTEPETIFMACQYILTALAARDKI